MRLIPCNSSRAATMRVRSWGRIFYQGGPVHQRYLFFLHRLDGLVEGGTKILDGLYFGGNLDTEYAEADILRPDAPRLRFYLGYAGWEPGQLEAEISAGTWFLAPGDPELVLASHTRNYVAGRAAFHGGQISPALRVSRRSSRQLISTPCPAWRGCRARAGRRRSSGCLLARVNAGSAYRKRGGCRPSGCLSWRVAGTCRKISKSPHLVLGRQPAAL